MSVSRASLQSQIADESDKSIRVKTPNVLFQRIAGGDGSAVRECIDKYGNWIWRIASAFEADSESAEDLSCYLFQAIWKNVDRISTSSIDERSLITLIASTEVMLRQRQSQAHRGV